MFASVRTSRQAVLDVDSNERLPALRSRTSEATISEYAKQISMAKVCQPCAEAYLRKLALQAVNKFC